jgi:hypothetical protein
VKVTEHVQKDHHHQQQQLKIVMQDFIKILILAVLVWQDLFVMLGVKQSILLVKLKKMVLSAQLAIIALLEQQNKQLKNVQLELKD